MGWEELTADLDSADVAVALHAVRTLRTLVRAEECRLVRLARSQDIGWRQIAELLGQSRMAVWERYRER